jgi:hypothetical protein
MEVPETQSEIRFTRTAIYRAIRNHDLQALHRALRRQSVVASVATQSTPSVLSRDEHTLFTYIHLVVVVADADCEHRLVPFVYALTNAGVDVDAVDCRRRTAVDLAIFKRLASIMEALLRTGADQARQGDSYKRQIARQPEPYRYCVGMLCNVEFVWKNNLCHCCRSQNFKDN